MSSSKLVGPGIVGSSTHFNYKLPKASPTEADQGPSALQAKHLSHIVGNRNSMHAADPDNARANPFSS